MILTGLIVAVVVVVFGASVLFGIDSGNLRTDQPKTEATQSETAADAAPVVPEKVEAP